MTFKYFLIPAIITILTLSAAAIMLISYINENSSSTEIVIEGEKIRFNFRINEEDLKNAIVFSQNLGVSDSWTKGGYLEVDRGTQANLSSFLPLQISMKITPRRLSFKSHVKLLKSVLPADNIEFSTQSGKLSWSKNNKGFFFELNKPAGIIKFATESGQVQISPKLYHLFPMFENIDKIELSIEKNNINGGMELR